MVYLEYSVEIDFDENFDPAPKTSERLKVKRFPDWQQAEQYILSNEVVFPVTTARIYRKKNGRRIPLKAYIREDGKLKSIPLV